jgi:hypothetical protein
MVTAGRESRSRLNSNTIAILIGFPEARLATPFTTECITRESRMVV